MRDVLIAGEEDRNRAVHGDIVVVQLYPEAQWRCRNRSLSTTTDSANTTDAGVGRPVPTGFVCIIYIITNHVNDQWHC